MENSVGMLVERPWVDFRHWNSDGVLAGSDSDNIDSMVVSVNEYNQPWMLYKIIVNPWLCSLQRRPLRRSWWRRPTWQRPLRSGAATLPPSLAGICPQPRPTSSWQVTRWPGRRSSPPTATTTTSCLTASSPSPRSYPRSVLVEGLPMCSVKTGIVVLLWAKLGTGS